MLISVKRETFLRPWLAQLLLFIYFTFKLPLFFFCIISLSLYLSLFLNTLMRCPREVIMYISFSMHESSMCKCAPFNLTDSSAYTQSHRQINKQINKNILKAVINIQILYKCISCLDFFFVATRMWVTSTSNSNKTLSATTGNLISRLY